jgi:hypothetical protein
MANSREDLFDTRNLQSSINPTSEVGSGPCITMEQLMRVVDRLTQPRQQEPNVQPVKVSLPRFNPEIAGTDPIAWCTVANVLMEDHPLQNSALYSALSDALEGSAAHWLVRTIGKGGISWPIFKERFITQFGGRETTSSALIKISKEPRARNESSGAYSNRLRDLVEMRLQDATKDEIFCAIALYMSSLHDPRFKRLALPSDIKTAEQYRSATRPFCYEDGEPTPLARRFIDGTRSQTSQAVGTLAQVLLL